MMQIAVFSSQLRFVAIAVCAFALLSVAVPSGSRSAPKDLLTAEDIRKISPQAKDDLIRAILDAQNDFRNAEMTSKLRMAHFLAQVMTETGGLRRLDENLNYNYDTLLRVFSRKTVSLADARRIAGNPQAVGNWVYGDRLGNKGRNTMDGWNYRGSGFLQLTGRTNFRVRGQAVNLPLEDNPELARKAREGLLAAIAYWDAQDINRAADNDDIRRVRILVNGPRAEGLPQAKIWFIRTWKQISDNTGLELGGDPTAESMANGQAAEGEGKLFDQILTESGLLPSTATESGADLDKMRKDAIESFQRDVGLPPTGVIDEATQYELLDPREWRYQDPENFAEAAPSDIDREQTTAFAIASSSDTGTESAELPASIEPGAGTGSLVASTELSQSDAAALSRAKGMYSGYELASRGPGTTSDDFVPFSVTLPDTREAVMDTTVLPARAITQIVFDTGSGKATCSGTMISKDTVLTAAHCIHSGTISGQPYRNFEVFPGRNVNTAPFGKCGARAAFVLSGWTTALTQEEGRYFDLGALKLDCDVGTRTGWLGVRALADDEVALGTVVEGYAGDRVPAGRQWRSTDKIDLLWELKGFYLNDTYGGTSGAAVFAVGAENMLIGVHTNGRHGSDDPWDQYNAFTRITPERLARIQEWIHD